MKGPRRTLAVCLVGLIVTHAVPVMPSYAQGLSPRATLTARAGTIAGAVVDGSDRPLAGARVQIRDLTSGRISMSTRADQNGQFRFAGIAAGSYVAEVLDDRGSVRAVGQTLTLLPGETVNTVIRLGANARWYQGFFTNAGLAAVVSAAGLGVTAVGSGFQPASGRF
jgi:hypothetical protein